MAQEITLKEQQDFKEVKDLPWKTESNWEENLEGYEKLLKDYPQSPNARKYQAKINLYNKKLGYDQDMGSEADMAFSSVEFAKLPESKKHKVATRSDLEKRMGIEESVREYFKFKGMSEPDFRTGKDLVISRRRKGVRNKQPHKFWGGIDLIAAKLGTREEQDEFIDFIAKRGHRVIDERDAWSKRTGNTRPIRGTIHIDQRPGNEGKILEERSHDARGNRVEPHTTYEEVAQKDFDFSYQPPVGEEEAALIKRQKREADKLKAPKIKTPKIKVPEPIAAPASTFPGMEGWEGKVSPGAEAKGGMGGFRAKGDAPRERVEEQINLMEQQHLKKQQPIVAERVQSDFVAQEDIGQLPGQGPQSQQAHFGAGRFKTPQITPDVSKAPPVQQAAMGAPGQIPMRDAGAVESGFEVEEVVKDEPPVGVVPSQDPDVVEDFSYEEKDVFARNLRDNPDQIEDMGEFELSEAVNKLPPVVYQGTKVFDQYSGLRANLLNKLGKVKKDQAPEAVGVRETVSIMKEPESDLSPIRTESPEEEAQDFVQKANELLQNEMERYKSKEFELSKIDPKRFWNNASTGQKILAAISMALGAYASGMTGQPNYAAKMIQGMVDADIDAQKDSNENKRLMKNEAYKRVLLQIGNLERAETRKFQKEKLGLLKQELGMKLMGLQQTAQKSVLGKVFGAAAFQKGGIPIKSWNIIRQQNPELAKRLQDMAVVIGDKVQFALNKDLAKSLNTTIKDMRLAGKSIQRLGDLSDDINWGEQAFKFWNAGKIEEAKAHARGLIGVMRESVVGGGVMTEQDRKLIESLIPNPDKFFRLTATDRARLKFLFNKANDNVSGAMKSAGIIVPVEQNIKVNKANIKQHLRSAGLDATPENIKKSIKILKKNRIWKAQSPLKYLLQG